MYSKVFRRDKIRIHKSSLICSRTSEDRETRREHRLWGSTKYGCLPPSRLHHPWRPQCACLLGFSLDCLAQVQVWSLDPFCCLSYPTPSSGICPLHLQDHSRRCSLGTPHLFYLLPFFSFFRWLSQSYFPSLVGTAALCLSSVIQKEGQIVAYRPPNPRSTPIFLW